jgi:phosphoserine aminotransferase
MLAVEDYLFALKWGKSIGGLDPLRHRADANARAIWNFCASRDWIDNLAEDKAMRSNTSVCLKFTDPRITDGAAFAKAVAKRLEAEKIALDVGAYRDAPAGLRFWCGATVETSDIEAMLPWLEWAYQTEIDALLQAA